MWCGRPATGTEELGTYMYLACLGVGFLRPAVLQAWLRIMVCVMGECGVWMAAAQWLWDSSGDWGPGHVLRVCRRWSWERLVPLQKAEACLWLKSVTSQMPGK